MWNRPSEEELRKLPAFYETESVPVEEKVIHLHFFIGSCDWYIVEYSPEEQLSFGFAILGGDLMNAEWGYTSFKELCEINVHGIEVDRDLHWRSRLAKQVEKIRTAQGWH